MTRLRYFRSCRQSGNSPTSNPDDCSPTRQANSGLHGGFSSLVRRILRREDATRLACADPRKSEISPTLSMLRRLEAFLTEEPPNSMQALPTEAQASSARPHGEATERFRDSAAEPEAMASLDMPSEFMAMVRGLENLYTQDGPPGMEEPPLEVQRSSTSACVEAAKHLNSTVEPISEAPHNPCIPPEFEAVQSVRFPITRSEPVQQEIRPSLKHKGDEFQQRQGPTPYAIDTVSERLEHLQTGAIVAAIPRRPVAEKLHFVAQGQRGFEELGASGQVFIDDTEKQLAVTVQSLLDCFIKTAIEKMRAELDASKHSAIAETQEQLALMCRASLEPVTRDLIQQVRAALTVSRGEFIEETKNQLAKMTRSSLQELESLATARVERVGADLMDTNKAFIDEVQKQMTSMTQAFESLVNTTVEHCRHELNRLATEFFANSIPQIESALRLPDAREEEAPPQTTRGRPDVPPSVLRHNVPSSRDGLEFFLAEKVPRHRIHLRLVRASFAASLRLAVPLAVIALAVFTIYASDSPLVRLRATPPAAFFAESPQWNAKQRAREDQLARAYWNIALRDIETKYRFGSSLPTDPPDIFKVEENGPSEATPRIDSAARARYWEKLREAWPRYDSWDQTDRLWEWIRNL
jgi:hypothetical protein